MSSICGTLLPVNTHEEKDEEMETLHPNTAEKDARMISVASSLSGYPHGEMQAEDEIAWASSIIQAGLKPPTISIWRQEDRQ